MTTQGISKWKTMADNWLNADVSADMLADCLTKACDEVTRLHQEVDRQETANRELLYALTAYAQPGSFDHDGNDPLFTAHFWENDEYGRLARSTIEKVQSLGTLNS